jgi:hypothetical protein
MMLKEDTYHSFLKEHLQHGKALIAKGKGKGYIWLTNQMRLIHLINQSDAFDIFD